jgi:hypothetical protein
MTWFRRTSQPEPDLGPTREELEGGFEPDDALGVREAAAAPIIEPPEWQDELDIAPGAAEWRAALSRHFAAYPEAEPEAGS